MNPEIASLGTFICYPYVPLRSLRPQDVVYEAIGDATLKQLVLDARLPTLISENVVLMPKLERVDTMFQGIPGIDDGTQLAICCKWQTNFSVVALTRARIAKLNHDKITHGHDEGVVISTGP